MGGFLIVFPFLFDLVYLFPWKKNIPVLVGTLKDGTLDARGVAAKALARIGLPAVPALINALRDRDENVRYWAVMTLGEIKDTRSVPALLTALKDKDEYVRSAAAEALGEIKDISAIPALIDALKDGDEYVRKVVAWTLENIKNSRL